MFFLENTYKSDDIFNRTSNNIIFKKKKIKKKKKLHESSFKEKKYMENGRPKVYNNVSSKKIPLKKKKRYFLHNGILFCNLSDKIKSIKNNTHSLRSPENFIEVASEKNNKNSEIKYTCFMEEKNTNKKKNKKQMNYISVENDLKNHVNSLKIKKTYNKKKCEYINSSLSKCYITKNKISLFNLINFKFNRKKKEKRNKLTVNDNFYNINKECVFNSKFNEINNLIISKHNKKKYNFNQFINNSIHTNKKRSIHLINFINNTNNDVIKKYNKETKSKEYSPFSITSKKKKKSSYGLYSFFNLLTEHKKKKTDSNMENSCNFSYNIFKNEKFLSKNSFMLPELFDKKFYKNLPITSNLKNKKDLDTTMSIIREKKLLKNFLNANLTKGREKIAEKNKEYLNEENAYEKKKENTHEENMPIKKRYIGKQIKKKNGEFLFDNNEHDSFINEINEVRKLITNNFKKNPNSSDEVILCESIKFFYEIYFNNAYKNTLIDNGYDKINAKYADENNLKDIHIDKNTKFKFIELSTHEQMKPLSLNKHFKKKIKSIENDSSKDYDVQLRMEPSSENLSKESVKRKKSSFNKNKINCNEQRCPVYNEHTNSSFFNDNEYNDIYLNELQKEKINKNVIKNKEQVYIERINKQEKNHIKKNTSGDSLIMNDNNSTKEELINKRNPTTIKFIKSDRNNNTKENNCLTNIYNLKYVSKNKNEKKEDELVNYNLTNNKKENKQNISLDHSEDNKKKIIFNRIYKNYLKNKNKATTEFIKKNSFYSKQTVAIDQFLYLKRDTENEKNKKVYADIKDRKYSKDYLHKEKLDHFNSLQDIYHPNEIKIKKKIKNLKKNRIVKLFVENDNIYVKDFKIYTNEERYKNVITNANNVEIAQREILSLPPNPVYLKELENYKCKLNRSIEIPALKIESEDINIFKYKNTWYELFFYNNHNNKETLYNYIIIRLNFELMIKQMKDIVIVDKNTEHFNFPYIYNAYLIPPISVHAVENSLRIQKITSDDSFINKGSWNFLKIKNESNYFIKRKPSKCYMDTYSSFTSSKKNLYIPLKNYYADSKDVKIQTSITNNLKMNMDRNETQRNKEQYYNSFLENNIRGKKEKEIKRNTIKIDQNKNSYSEKSGNINNNIFFDNQNHRSAFLNRLMCNSPCIYITFSNSKIEPVFPYICENIFFLFEYYYKYLHNSIKYLKENNLNKHIIQNINKYKDVNKINNRVVTNISSENIKTDEIKKIINIKDISIRKNLYNNELNNNSDNNEKNDSLNITSSVDVNNFKIRNFINSKLYDSIFNNIRDKNSKKIKRNLDKEDVEIPIYLWVVFGGKDMKSMDSLNIVYKILRYATEIPPVEYEKYVRKLKRIKIKKNFNDEPNSNLSTQQKSYEKKKVNLKKEAYSSTKKETDKLFDQVTFSNENLNKNIPNDKGSFCKYITQKNLSDRKKFPELPRNIFCNKNLYNASIEIYSRIVSYYNEYNNSYIVYGPKNYNDFLEIYDKKKKEKKKKKKKKEKENEDKREEKKEKVKNIYINRSRKYLKSSEISDSAINKENLFYEHFKKNKNIQSNTNFSMNECFDNLKHMPFEKNKVDKNEEDFYDFFLEESNESSDLSDDDELFNFISYHMQGRNPSFEKRKKKFGNNRLNYTDIYGPLIYKNKKKTGKVKYSFLLLDYPAYNNSIGHPSPLTFKTSAFTALKEALKEIKKTNKGKSISINIFGYSLGCSVSLQLVLDIAKSLYNDFFEDINKVSFEKKESEPIKEIKNEGDLYIKLNNNRQKINEYVYDEKKILTFEDIFFDEINSSNNIVNESIRKKSDKDNDKIKLENAQKGDFLDNILNIKNSDKLFDLNKNNFSFFSSENCYANDNYMDNNYFNNLEIKTKNNLNNKNSIKRITTNEILNNAKIKKKIKENFLKNELNITINKVVLVAPFTNTQRLVKNILKNSIFYLLSSFVMNKKCSYVHWDNKIVLKEFFKIINDFKKNKYLSEIFQNLTIDFIHGKKDTLVSYEMSLKLYKLANKMILKYSLNNIKCFLHIFENENHSSILNSDSENRILQIIFRPLRLHPFSTINIHKFHFNLYKDMYLLKTVYLQYIANACLKKTNV